MGIAIARRKQGPARAMLAAWLLAAAVVPASAAQAKSVSGEVAAENFVRADVQKGLDVINNRSLSDVERRAQLREFLGSLTDIRSIALFTLGPMRQYATPAQIDQFVDAFRDYAVAAYESRLKDYSGQSLSVTGCIQAAPGNFIVTTALVDPAGRTARQGEPIEVDFRVVDGNGHYAVIDLGVAGLWLALEERDQFTNFLENNNGNFGGLIVHLKVMTERLRNGSQAPRVATDSSAR